MILTIWVAAAITALVLYLHQVYSKLSRAGVNHLPTVPFFGNLFRTFIKQEHMVDVIQKSCLSFPDDRIVGLYEMMTPVMTIKDVDLIKKIAIKDFEYFIDRRAFANEMDPLFGRSLLLMKGEEWKAMRATLSPAFTSSKIRLMVPFIVEVGEEMIKVLKTRIQESGHSYIDVEGKDLATRYANDVIASCAFGLKVVSHADDNLFYRMCRDIFIFNYLRFVKVFVCRCFPKVAKVLRISLSNSATTEFFQSLVLSTMKNREQQNIIRNDMIHLLIEAKKGQLSHEAKASKDADAGFATVEESGIGRKQHNKEWSDTDLIAQAVLFLFAGFDTVSTVMSFMLHELAANPYVQERLYQEICDNARNNGKVDYNAIQKMVYMDMVVSELLRLWPAAPFTDRECVMDYNAGKPNSIASEDLIIRKGEYVNIPIWLFHRSPENFPNPTKFDPERFSEQNKHNIKPFTYMPFGLGPRNCIGSRFALCEIKVMLYQILQNFEVYPSERTVIPAQLDRSVVNMRIRGGAWVRMRIRQ